MLEVFTAYCSILPHVAVNYSNPWECNLIFYIYQTPHTSFLPYCCKLLFIVEETAMPFLWQPENFLTGFNSDYMGCSCFLWAPGAQHYWKTQSSSKGLICCELYLILLNGMFYPDILKMKSIQLKVKEVSERIPMFFLYS